MPDAVRLIPLAAIAETALTRDRTAPDPDAMAELRASILATGLRMPVEIYALPHPLDPHEYGLISGFRRLTAFRELAADWPGDPRFTAIPAFLRAPRDTAEALTAMVEENAIRASVSPWEQAAIAVTARDHGTFPSIEQAVDALYASLSRDRRKRLRAIAHLVEELDGLLTEPESLSLRQVLRLAAATSRGYAPVIAHALEESRSRTPDTQWRLLLPVLAEAEDATIPDPAPQARNRTRPCRTWDAPRHALRIRRERTRDGWCLHFTGRDAHGDLIDAVFDHVEHLLSPA